MTNLIAYYTKSCLLVSSTMGQVEQHMWEELNHCIRRCVVVIQLYILIEYNIVRTDKQRDPPRCPYPAVPAGFSDDELGRPSTCTRLACGSSWDETGRFLSPSFSFVVAARRASRSCFSFSRRSAFDSNSCQSPSMAASLRRISCQVQEKERWGNLLGSLSRGRLLRREIGVI